MGPMFSGSRSGRTRVRIIVVRAGVLATSIWPTAGDAERSIARFPLVISSATAIGARIATITNS